MFGVHKVAGTPVKLWAVQNFWYIRTLKNHHVDDVKSGDPGEIIPVVRYRGPVYHRHRYAAGFVRI